MNRMEFNCLWNALGEIWEGWYRVGHLRRMNILLERHGQRLRGLQYLLEEMEPRGSSDERSLGPLGLPMEPRT